MVAGGGGIKHFWIEYHGYKQQHYYCIALFLVINFKKLFDYLKYIIDYIKQRLKWLSITKNL